MDVVLGIMIGLVVAIVAIIVFAFIFMWIWNLVMPEVFGLKTIGPWQALGMMVLASILFGGHRVVDVHHYGPSPHTMDATAP